MAYGEGGGAGACREQFWVLRKGSPATYKFTMNHENSSKMELYATKRMVHITEEGPKEYLLYLYRSPLDYYIASSVIPSEEGVERQDIIILHDPENVMLYGDVLPTP